MPVVGPDPSAGADLAVPCRISGRAAGAPLDHQDLGPLLDDVADAYKAKKDADVKKHAKAALDVAGAYKKTIEGIPYQCRIEAGQRLNHITKALAELKEKGTAANDYFKKF